MKYKLLTALTLIFEAEDSDELMQFAIEKLYTALTGKKDVPQEIKDKHTVFKENRKNPEELIKLIQGFIEEVSGSKECVPIVNDFLITYIKANYDTEEV